MAKRRIETTHVTCNGQDVVIEEVYRRVKKGHWVRDTVVYNGWDEDVDLAAMALGLPPSPCIAHRYGIDEDDDINELLALRAAEGWTDAVKILLQMGANPRTSAYPFEYGSSEYNHLEPEMDIPLRAAALMGHVDVARILIDAGADPTTWNHDMTTYPLMIAIVNNDQDMLDLIYPYVRQQYLPGGPEYNSSHALMEAITTENVPLALFFIDEGHNVHASREAPIRFAVEHQLPEVVQALLDAGANPRVGNGEPLSLALDGLYKNDEIARMLLEWYRENGVWPEFAIDKMLETLD
jgi:hypothetical protein